MVLHICHSEYRCKHDAATIVVAADSAVVAAAGSLSLSPLSFSLFSLLFFSLSRSINYIYYNFSGSVSVKLIFLRLVGITFFSIFCILYSVFQTRHISETMIANINPMEEISHVSAGSSACRTLMCITHYITRWSLAKKAVFRNCVN